MLAGTAAETNLDSMCGGPGVGQLAVSAVGTNTMVLVSGVEMRLTGDCRCSGASHKLHSCFARPGLRHVYAVRLSGADRPCAPTNGPAPRR